MTEDRNLPADVKRSLAKLRGLDAQAQELYERMQKQSKNHIARAKRSVQGGHSPDEDLLLKAQKSSRELLEVDSEKVACADQLYDDLSRHLERCEGELHKFEEELREKGQLKTPANVKASAPPSEPSGAAGSEGTAGGLSVQVGGLAHEMPAPLGTGGRRGRQPSAVALPEASPTSHKRGRGRKVSHKEAERQRAAQEAAACAASQSVRAEQMLAPQGFGCGASPHGSCGDFGSFGAAQRQEYPDATLPMASREDSNRPLCGAIPAPPTYIIPERHKVAAQITKQDWILASILKFNTVNNKYIILDADEGEEPDPLGGSAHKQHQVPSKFVLPLPLYEPSIYTAHNELRGGQMVLALYPDTTCFYKAIVHTPPSARRQRDYLVEFEDENEPTGRGEATNVPQKYVLPIPDYAR